MYSRLRFIWIVEWRTSSIIWNASPLWISGLGKASVSRGMALAAEISGNGMMERNSLAQRDLACRHDDEALHARTRRVGRCRGRCVPRRGADAGAAPRCGCPAHSHRHAAVLERGRRVHPLELQEQADPDAIRDPRGLDQGRLPLAYGGYGIIRNLWQPPAVPPDNTLSRHPRLNVQYKLAFHWRSGRFDFTDPESSREQ